MTLTWILTTTSLHVKIGGGGQQEEPMKTDAEAITPLIIIILFRFIPFNEFASELRQRLWLCSTFQSQ